MRALTGLYRQVIGVTMSKRTEFIIFQVIIESGNENSHLDIANMYRNGEGTKLNVKKSIHHFEIGIRHNLVDGNWNPALLYGSEQELNNRNRSVYHHRIAAHLGHSEATEIVAKYFLSATGPRRMSSTPFELAEFF